MPAHKFWLLPLLISLALPAEAADFKQFPVTPNPELSAASESTLNREADPPLRKRPPSVPGAASPVPPQLQQMQEVSEGIEAVAADNRIGLEIRHDALREAALSYGARGGLAWRTFAIQRRLAEQERVLTRVYDFRRLLISAQSGLLLEPPIITEAEQAVIVQGGGQMAAVADRIYRINQGARIVTAPRDWRLYLERDWGAVEPPPQILLPQNTNERALWRDYVAEGWTAGIEQADEIFQADLDRMNQDFIGMVRYRELLAQNMISPPFALAEDRGITGGGNELRVGDRGLTITGQPALIPRGETWQPKPR